MDCECDRVGYQSNGDFRLLIRPLFRAPSEATFQAPAGTIQDYNSYQNGVNKVVLSSAEQALASQSGGGGAISGNIGAAARRRDMSSVATWTGVLAVAMGFGVGAAML